MISVKNKHQLTCPECGETLVVPEPELAIGRRVRCEHCGAEPYLDHCREWADEPAEWRLVSSLPEEDRKAG